MIADIGEVFSAQKDGSPPTILASGCAPGESGVSVVSLRFQGSAHFYGLSAAASGRFPFEDPDQVPRGATRAASQRA